MGEGYLGAFGAIEIEDEDRIAVGACGEAGVIGFFADGAVGGTGADFYLVVFARVEGKTSRAFGRVDAVFLGCAKGDAVVGESNFFEGYDFLFFVVAQEFPVGGAIVAVSYEGFALVLVLGFAGENHGLEGIDFGDDGSKALPHDAVGSEEIAYKFAAAAAFHRFAFDVAEYFVVVGL